MLQGGVPETNGGGFKFRRHATDAT
jgi:hypothetical protein